MRTLKFLSGLICLLLAVPALAQNVSTDRQRDNIHMVGGKYIQFGDSPNYLSINHDATNANISLNGGGTINVSKLTVTGDATFAGASHITGTPTLATLNVTGSGTIGNALVVTNGVSAASFTASGAGSFASISASGTTTTTGAVLNRVGLTAGDQTNLCTTGDLRVDNANTRELCYCVSSNNYMCFKQDSTGPFD